MIGAAKQAGAAEFECRPRSSMYTALLEITTLDVTELSIGTSSLTREICGVG